MISDLWSCYGASWLWEKAFTSLLQVGHMTCHGALNRHVPVLSTVIISNGISCCGVFVVQGFLQCWQIYLWMLFHVVSIVKLLCFLMTFHLQSAITFNGLYFSDSTVVYSSVHDALSISAWCSEELCAMSVLSRTTSAFSLDHWLWLYQWPENLQACNE